MVIFHSYVSLPEGKYRGQLTIPMFASNGHHLPIRELKNSGMGNGVFYRVMFFCYTM